MWTKSHTVTTAATASVIWPLYAELANWPLWDKGALSVSIDGPFALGSTIVMELEGRRNVALVITAFDDGRRFVTESPGPGVTIIFDHLIVETPGHFSGVVTTITHTVTIDGPNVDNVGEHMGKVITHDLPDTLAAIAALAENVRDAAMR